MRTPAVTTRATARWLVVMVAVVVGALVGLWAGPVVWSLLDAVGVVAVPACNDVFHGTVQALCARPRSMEVVALATAAACAAVSGIVAWRLLLRGAAAGSTRRDEAS